MEEDDRPDFRLLENRRRSFERWPVSFLSPDEMSAAGFYYLLRGDAVKCFECGVTVESWVEGDNPSEDHLRWSPNCKYIANIDDSTAAEENCGVATRLARLGIVESGAVQSEDDVDVYELKKVRYEKYASLAARLRSFAEKGWPVCMQPMVERMSEAGLFYTGKGDKTLCFYCGVSLHMWQERDDPWIEHAVWHSECQFVTLVRGKRFVDEVTRNRKDKVNNDEGCEIRCGSDKDGPVESRDDGGGQVGGTDSRSDLACKICCEEQAELVNLPCGHLIACVQCGLSLSGKCPICRGTILAFVRVYL